MQLLTKTCRKDLPWLELSIKSVAVYAQEQINWMIVCDADCYRDVAGICTALRFWHSPHKIRFDQLAVEEKWPEALKMGGYQAQQVIKMLAHRAIPSGYFWNVDSDVLFQRPFTQSDFCVNNKPIYWYSYFNDLMKSGGPDYGAHFARRSVLRQIFTDEGIDKEHMRCMPICLAPELLAKGEETIFWKDSLQKLKVSDPSFSEFNVIGEYFHRFFPGWFIWKCAETEGPTFSSGYVEGGKGSGNYDGRSLVSQFYSWDGPPPEDVVKKVNSLGDGVVGHLS